MSLRMQLWNPDRWHIGKELTSIQREMDRFFEDLSTQFPHLSSRKDVDFVPACDVEETDTQYLISVDVPGMKKEELAIEFTNDLLTISGEHKEEKKEETKRRTISERYQGRFERRFALPNAVGADNVEANFANGVLSISVKKAAMTGTKQIPIGEMKPVAKIPVKEPVAGPRTGVCKSAAA